jgi:sugar lactone lactonase YvrE
MRSLYAIVILVGPCCLAQNYPPLSVYAGTPLGNGFSGDGGQATNASLANPIGVAVDWQGNLYVADSCNNRVRKIDTSGIITTVAGSGNSQGICNTATGYSGDGGPATAAALNLPTGVAADSTGNLYIADAGNQVIRKVDSNGIISTFAGGGTAYPGDGGPATSASLGNLIEGLAVDASGNLYLADGSSMVRQISPDGTITTIAGMRSSGYSGDGGPATQATLSSPTGLALDASGNLYIADTANCVIRQVTNGIITTIAGTNASCGLYFASSGDGGPATSAQLTLPWGVGVDAAGNLYIAAPNAYNVREVLVSDGTIHTIFGSGENYSYQGSQSNSQIRQPAPYDVVVSGTTAYIPDQFFKVVWLLDVSGSITTDSNDRARRLRGSDLRF